MEKIDLVQARVKKLQSSPKLVARLHLADRLAAMAMRVGCFNMETARMIGEFEPWGIYVRDVKRLLDANATAKKAEKVAPPLIPSNIESDLRFAVTYFAIAGGVDLPKGWLDVDI